MTSIRVEGLTLAFPEGWEASKFDGWSFYTGQFKGMQSLTVPCGAKDCGKLLRCAACGAEARAGIKAVDVLAVEGTECCWYIEVKDYRSNPRTKAIGLAEEVALKVRDSLAGVAAARINANDAGEKRMAGQALRCKRIRVILHLEQPVTPSRTRPRAIDPANVVQRLRQLVRAIDPHPMVIETTRMQAVAWEVT